MITLKQQKFSQSDPPIFKKIAVRSSPDPSKISFSPVQSDPALIRADLWLLCSVSAIPPNEPSLKELISQSELSSWRQIFWKILLFGPNFQRGANAVLNQGRIHPGPALGGWGPPPSLDVGAPI